MTLNSLQLFLLHKIKNRDVSFCFLFFGKKLQKNGNSGNHFERRTGVGEDKSDRGGKFCIMQ